MKSIFNGSDFFFLNIITSRMPHAFGFLERLTLPVDSHILNFFFLARVQTVQKEREECLYCCLVRYSPDKDK